MADKKIKGLTVEIGADVSGLNKAFADANKAVKDTQSELNQVNKLLKLDPSNVVLLEQKQQLLAQQTANTTEKLEALKRQREALNAVENKDDEWAAAMRGLDRDIQNTEISLNKLTETAEGAGETSGKLGDETEDAGKAMDDAGDSASRFGDMLKANLTSEAIIGGVKALAGAVKDAAGAMKDAVMDGAAYADNILTLSTNTGLSTQQLQEFQYMAELTDTSLDTITGSMAKLVKNMDSARDGTGSAADAFAALGVSVTNADGTLRGNQDVFGEVIDALGRMDNATERDAASMTIFGKSAQDLNSFIAQGSEGIAAFAQEARNMGYVLGDDALASLGAVDDAFQRLSNTGTAAKNMLAAALAPTITDIADEVLPQLMDGLQSVSAGFEEGGIFGALYAALDALEGFADSIIARLPAIMEAGGQILLSLAGRIVDGLPELIKTGLEIITSLAQGIADALPELIPTVVDVVTEIVETLTDPDTLGGMLDAALEIILALAEGLVNAIPRLLEAVPEIIDNLLDTILDAIPQIVETGVKLLSMLVGNLPTIIQNVIRVLPEIIANIVITLMDHLPDIIQAGVDLFIALVENLPTIIIEIVKAVPAIVTAIVDAFTEKFHDIVSVGENLIKGLWEGISNMVSWIGEKIRGFGEGILNGLKNFFGIQSPSKVFRDTIGKNLALGIGEGFEENIDRVARQMEAAIPDIGADYDLGLNAAPGALTLTGPSWAGAARPLTATVDAQGLSGALSAALAGFAGGRTPNITITFAGDLAQLGRVLQPVVTAETERIGPSFSGRS